MLSFKSSYTAWFVENIHSLFFLVEKTRVFGFLCMGNVRLAIEKFTFSHLKHVLWRIKKFLYKRKIPFYKSRIFVGPFSCNCLRIDVKIRGKREMSRSCLTIVIFYDLEVGTVLKPVQTPKPEATVLYSWRT